VAVMIAATTRAATVNAAGADVVELS